MDKMMKKILYSIIAGVAALCACQPETVLERPFDLYQVKSLEAVAGDNAATVSWTTQDGKPNPQEFLLTWAAEMTGVEGGQMTLEAEKREVVIEDLVNDCGYTFAIQARYSNGLSQKVTSKCTPKTSRFAVTDFKANAGSERVLLSWTKPVTDRLSSYTITWIPGNGEQKITEAATERYMVENLTNDTEYTFSITCNYPNGDSETCVASATPGLVIPIIASVQTPVKMQTVSFEYNPMYFMAGDVKSVAWEFSDGETAEGLKVLHAFANEGKATVKANVTYADGATDSGSIELTVNGYSWSKKELKAVKASNPVFSPDGSTLYISTSDGTGDVYALDTWTGEQKWVYPIEKVTYGGGPAVGPDGSIYVGAQGAKFYAIKPDGTEKWTFETCGNVEGFPAVTSDNNIYVVANGTVATLYSINANTGAAEWTKELAGGTGSAVVVDADGNVYVGTNEGIWSFTADGTQRWNTTGINVTERGSFAINGTVLYAALKKTDGVAAIDMATGDVKWKSAKGSNDSYFPIVGPDGTVYYTSKGGKRVYAINPDGSLKWETEEAAALIYAGVVLTKDGKLYIGTQANIGDSKQLLTIDAATGSFTMEPSDQIMSAFTFGPDARVYYGTVGKNLCTIETAGPADSWSMRGGNIQGTNSLK